jgi:hypothetical protein
MSDPIHTALLIALGMRAPNVAWSGPDSHRSPLHGGAGKTDLKTEDCDAIQFYYPAN